MEFKNMLKDTLQKSSEIRILDFAIDICERQKNEYLNFSLSTGFGSPGKIELVIDKIKAREIFDSKAIEKYISDLEEVCPNTEDFQIIEVSYALNYVTSVIDLLHYIESKDKEFILNISSYFLDTIDFKIYDKKMDNSQMEKEMDRQINFIL
jgi:uncharacterized protein YjaG (DUF416 family)